VIILLTQLPRALARGMKTGKKMALAKLFNHFWAKAHYFLL
jgi:hypothetical protein